MKEIAVKMLRGFLAIAAIIAVGGGIVCGTKHLWFNSGTTPESVQDGSESAPPHAGSTLGKGSQGEQSNYPSWVPTIRGFKSCVPQLLPFQQKSSGRANGNAENQEIAVTPTSGGDKNRTYFSVAVESTTVAVENALNYLKRKKGANPPSKSEATYCQTCQRSLKTKEENGDEEILITYSRNTERILDGCSTSAVVSSVNQVDSNELPHGMSSTNGTTTIMKLPQSMKRSETSVELMKTLADTSSTVSSQNTGSNSQDVFHMILREGNIVAPDSATVNASSTNNLQLQLPHSPEETLCKDPTESSELKIEHGIRCPPSSDSITSDQTVKVPSAPTTEPTNCNDKFAPLQTV